MEEILHQLIGSLFHHLQDITHPRWLAGFLPSTVWCWSRIEQNSTTWIVWWWEAFPYFFCLFASCLFPEVRWSPQKRSQFANISHQLESSWIWEWCHRKKLGVNPMCYSKWSRLPLEFITEKKHSGNEPKLGESCRLVVDGIHNPDNSHVQGILRAQSCWFSEKIPSET